jgi:hypothetical protein
MAKVCLNFVKQVLLEGGPKVAEYNSAAVSRMLKGAHRNNNSAVMSVTDISGSLTAVEERGEPLSLLRKTVAVDACLLFK